MNPVSHLAGSTSSPLSFLQITLLEPSMQKSHSSICYRKSINNITLLSFLFYDYGLELRLHCVLSHLCYIHLFEQDEH